MTDTKTAAGKILIANSGPRNTTPDPAPKQEPGEPRMIGDFDGSANEFWKLYRDESKSHDDARISTLKDDMESALIFVRSYSIRTYYGLGYADAWPTGWFIFCRSHCICTR